MSRQPKKYYTASGIDYLEHFAQLWVGFNAWYRIQSPTGGDARACMNVAANGVTRKSFATLMTDVDKVDTHITKTLDQLSTYAMHGGGTEKVDVSGDKLRLRASRSNSIIDFFESAKRSGVLDPETDGLVFLDSDDRSGVFRSLYSAYSAHMATSAMMVHPTDAKDYS